LWFSGKSIQDAPWQASERCQGVGKVTADMIQKGSPFRKAEKEISTAEKNGVQLLFFSDKNYPTRLKQLDDAPTLLYTKGQHQL
jgi:DNA processing protein